MIKLYAVRDVKADGFVSPFFAATAGLATRALQEVVRDPRSDLSKWPSDYQLYELGEFNEGSGEMVGYKLPKYIISMSDLAQLPVKTFTEMAREAVEGKEVAKEVA